MRTALFAEELKKEFTETQADLLAQVIVNVVEESHNDLVKARDFRELKDIVKSLAEAQERTDRKIEKLTEAQERTDRKIEKLIEAQELTERKIEKLTEAQEKLTEAQEKTEMAIQKTEREIQELVRVTKILSHQIGGLAKSVAYALENEAYRVLPPYLKKEYGLEITEKFIRQGLEGHEINLLAKGIKNGKEVLIIGEATLRLDDIAKFGQLEENMRIILRHYPGHEVMLFVITHYATEEMLKKAREAGVIVVQSFQWNP